MAEISAGRTAAQAAAEGNKTLAELHSSTLRFAAIRARHSFSSFSTIGSFPFDINLLGPSRVPTRRKIDNIIGLIAVPTVRGNFLPRGRPGSRAW